ncbi:hypothetical protein COU54_03040 [Candidatus Pacearchaeota archaeon CG10_big_fil_rev_8_21_14_0_10_31_24]|nr:MAG: hypothetical protein COU54_03040 [Candidatus Pacearchaeota archaeon CG10_big_fil_rev_8_21_14_0_10_31_24]
MNKKTITILAIAIVLVGIGIFIQKSYFPNEGDQSKILRTTGSAIIDLDNTDPNKIKIDKTSSSFNFEGYSIAKNEIGTFDDFEGNILLENNNIVGIEGIVNVSSVNTGKVGLDKHLRNDDFFDVAVYPELSFKTTSLNEENGQKIMTGVLTFRGISKEVGFPVVIEDNKVSANFLLDTTPFEMKYAGVNKEVRIEFSFSD